MSLAGQGFEWCGSADVGEPMCNDMGIGKEPTK